MSSKREASSKKEKPFRLKSKPKKPRRSKFKNHISIDSGISLKEILQQIQNHYDVSLKPEEVIIEHNYERYDDYYSIYARWEVEEPEEDFQRRLERYKKRLAEWEKWYTQNQSQIEATLAARKAKAEERAQNRIIAERKKLEKELSRLEKQEKRLRK